MSLPVRTAQSVLPLTRYVSVPACVNKRLVVPMWEVPCRVWPSAPHPSALQTQTEEEGGLAGQPGGPNRPGSGRPGHLTRPCPPQAKHLASQYWGSSRPTAVRRDPSLPYLEQYRIDAGQFRELFASLTPWACGSHTPVLAGRMFRLLDENKDSLINFKEFVTGMSE